MLMLIFHIGDDCYGCSCDWIVEIVPNVLLKQLPHSPSYFAGLMNYSGESVPVIDFTTVMLDRPSNHLMSNRIIIFNDPIKNKNFKQFGLIVEEVVEAVEMDVNLFVETGLEIKNTTFLKGIYNSESGSIQLIKIDSLYESLAQRLNP